MGAPLQSVASNGALKIVIITVAWYTASSLANNFSKNFLTTFNSPATLTYVQFLFKATLSTLLLLYRNRFRWLSGKDFVRAVGPLGVGNMMSHWLTHLSTSFLAVSFTQTIKAAAPLFAVFLSMQLMGEHFSRRVLMSLIPIVLGVTMCTLTEVNFNLIGFLCAVSATMVFVIQNIYSKRLFRELELDNVQLVMYVSYGALLVMTPMFLMQNAWLILDPSPLLVEARGGYPVWMVLVANATCHWLQTILAFKMLLLVSPVTYSVANSCKRIFVIISSVLYFQNPVTRVNMMGILLASFGVLAYNHARALQKRDTQKRNELPTVMRV